MASTGGVSHVHIYVKDLQRSQRFYESAFDLAPRMASAGLVFLGTRDGSDSLALHQDPAMSDRVGDNGGYAHFGIYAVDRADLAAVASDVEHAGGTIVERGEHAPGVPYLLVVDPDGYLIEV